MLRSDCNALLYSSAIICVAISTPATAQAKSFDIPTQSVDTAIGMLGRQADVQIMAARRATRGKQANAVRGNMTIQEALNRLLAGTGLVARPAGARTYSVVPGQAAPAAREMRPASSAQNGGGLPRDQAVALAADTAGANEEIVVTAQKREQRLIDVPMSVAAVSALEIERRKLVSAEDYLRGMPGVNQVDSGFGPSVSVRGLETTTTSQNFASGSTVAMYFGEVSTTSSTGMTGGAGADFKLVDIERVEVLKGPQGTAFGSSSIGGVVRIIPASPRLDRFEGRISAGATSTADTGGTGFNVQGVANLPIVDDVLAVRAVAYHFNDSGFYRGIAGTDPVIQAAAIRTGSQQYAVSDDELGGSKFTGARVSALFRPTDRLKITATFVTQKTLWDAWAGSNRGGYDQAILRVGPADQVFGLSKGGTRTNVDLYNVVAEYDLGWADLLATYAHIDGRSTYAFPWSTSGTNPMVSATNGQHKEDNGELRIATKFSGPVNFLAGVYAESLTDFYTQSVYWYGSVASNPFVATVPYATPNLLADTRDDFTLKQRAVFGEVSWEILSGLTLTGGARAYEYDRSATRSEKGPLLAPAAPTAVRTVGGKTSASGTNFKANLSYKPSDDMMVYAGWSQGFRPGKTQAGLPAGACDVNPVDGIVDGTSISLESTREVQSDSIDSYEAGAKGRLMDGRVTASFAAFRADWSGIPVQVRATCAGGTLIGYTANAGAARSEGLEGQITIQATRNLRFDLGAAYIDARLTQAVPAQGFKVGDRLPSPSKTANFAVQYSLPIFGHEGYLRADAAYVGPFNSRIPPTGVNRAGDYVKLDLAGGISMGGTQLDVFVKNVTNDNSVTFVPTPYPTLRLRPRTIGLQLSHNF
jgi:outer membrane receptor protein involved in Fe transport